MAERRSKRPRRLIGAGSRIRPAFGLVEALAKDPEARTGRRKTLPSIPTERETETPLFDSARAAVAQVRAGYWVCRA